MATISLKYKSKFGNLTAPAEVDLGAMIPLMTTTLSTSAASVTFSDIPQSYEHLQIRAILKDNTNSTGATNIEMRFNSDSGSNYTRHYFRGTGTAVDSGASTSDSKFTVGTAIQNGAGLTNMFGAMIVDIFDYTNTNKYKTVRALSGQDSNGAGTQGTWLQSGVWMNTNTLTSISLFSSSSNINTYSSFALYGIKKAGA